MVEQLTTAASHPSLRHSVLPGTSDRTTQWHNAHGANCGRHFESILGVVIEHDESGNIGKRESVSELLSRPHAGRMPRHVEVQNPSPIVGNNEEAVQKAKGYRGHGEEIHGGNDFAVVMKKSSPMLRPLCVSRCAFHPPGHSTFRNIEAQH